MSDGPSIQELVDEARQHIAYPWVEDGDALRVGRLADALEDAEQRITELETDRDDWKQAAIVENANAKGYRTERDALAAVIEQAPHTESCHSLYAVGFPSRERHE